MGHVNIRVEPHQEPQTGRRVAGEGGPVGRGFVVEITASRRLPAIHIWGHGDVEPAAHGRHSSREVPESLSDLAHGPPAVPISKRGLLVFVGTALWRRDVHHSNAHHLGFTYLVVHSPRAADQRNNAPICPTPFTTLRVPFVGLPLKRQHEHEAGRTRRPSWSAAVSRYPMHPDAAERTTTLSSAPLSPKRRATAWTTPLRCAQSHRLEGGRRLLDWIASRSLDTIDACGTLSDLHEVLLAGPASATDVLGQRAGPQVRNDRRRVSRHSPPNLLRKQRMHFCGSSLRRGPTSAPSSNDARAPFGFGLGL
ncbi:hypothetical protein MSAN_02371300 [Mycena sanguinolenta]|uniref:Uncharacterized protein n=1 Tax=Mycena sanguinolenta TaxID=230812 RepID=A0A8H6X5Y9_9AGAR|nr:hypothetical protein MSAN_02371300 [Mycena sanguinolenta]